MMLRDLMTQLYRWNESQYEKVKKKGSKVQMTLQRCKGESFSEDIDFTDTDFIDVR